MQIIRDHGTVQTAAMEKIDSFLDKLMKRDFSGVKIKDPDKSWRGTTMTFSFRAKKGIVVATIRGTVEVTATQVILCAQLPALVTTFVSEEMIRNVINSEFDKLFSIN